ncbi:uncharacterized protein LOC109404086 isoform X1 [Aedes albopictus]|uniref:DUF4806 domain-containing protein n=1 Tax=Aedes albopictus TaxID=7160 RepID=A0ABM1XZ14_AEDAL
MQHRTTSNCFLYLIEIVVEDIKLESIPIQVDSTLSTTGNAVLEPLAETHKNEDIKLHKVDPRVHEDAACKRLHMQLKINQKERRPPSRKHSKSVRVAGFEFPLSCEEDVDRLELMVKRNPIIRNQYIKYLAANKLPNMEIAHILYRFFNDEALSNFNWTGQERYDSSASGKKKSMQKFDIFNSCMLEAWSSHGVTQDALAGSLKKAVQLVARRRYNLIYNQRKRIEALDPEH